MRVKPLGPWWTVGGKETSICSQSTPEQNGRGTGIAHLIHHSHTNGISCLCVREHWLCWVYTFSCLAGTEKYGEKQMWDIIMKKQMLRPPSWCLRSDLGPGSSGWASQGTALLWAICKEAAWTSINFNHCLSNLKWQFISLIARSVWDNALSSTGKKER